MVTMHLCDPGFRWLKSIHPFTPKMHVKERQSWLPACEDTAE